MRRCAVSIHRIFEVVSVPVSPSFSLSLSICLSCMRSKKRDKERRNPSTRKSGHHASTPHSARPSPPLTPSHPSFPVPDLTHRFHKHTLLAPTPRTAVWRTSASSQACPAPRRMRPCTTSARTGHDAVAACVRDWIGLEVIGFGWVEVKHTPSAALGWASPGYEVCGVLDQRGAQDETGAGDRW